MSIGSIWEWVKNLFSKRSKLTTEELIIKKEKEMQSRPSIKEVAKAVKNKITGTEVHEAVESSFVVTVEAGTMNRSMRRFMKSMGWSKPDGTILDPRKTTKELWQAINSLKALKVSKHEKRRLFKRAFGA